MTSRIRFSDAADVFATYPGLELISERPAAAIDPLDHARALAASQRPVTALAFLAHLLPRREAVWWGCQCVGALLESADRDAGLRLATLWVRDPNEDTRREALAHAETSGLRTPGGWLARAVGYSGGSILAPDQPPTPPPPDACALAVNGGVVVAATGKPSPAILPWIRACAEAGIRFASGEDARVIPPGRGATGGQIG